jgi:adenylate kinase family enzyme
MSSDVSGAELQTAGRPDSGVSEGTAETEAGVSARARAGLGPRVIVYGNAGSGKSTYAAHLARREGLVHLDLDTIVWEPGKVAVPRSTSAVHSDLQRFLDTQTRWVIEGCYSEWVEVASTRCTELVFLNPGEAVCVAHCRARPWEPHKYTSLDEQNKMLAFLLEWVRAYYTREDSCSLQRHRRLFDEFRGAKRQCIAPAALGTSEATPSK